MAKVAVVTNATSALLMWKVFAMSA